MRLLLDTHALIWFLQGMPQLSERARHAIESTENQVFVSAASLWEIAIKINLGKLDLMAPLEEIFPRQLAANNFVMLPVEIRHLYVVGRMERIHRDPFDRLIIAQASVEALTIVTCDPQFPPYGVPTLW